MPLSRLHPLRAHVTKLLPSRHCFDALRVCAVAHLKDRRAAADNAVNARMRRLTERSAAYTVFTTMLQAS